MNLEFMHGKSHFSNQKCAIILTHTITLVLFDQTLDIFSKRQIEPLGPFVLVLSFHFPQPLHPSHRLIASSQFDPICEDLPLWLMAILIFVLHSWYYY
jgi:hypothetical protein